MKNRYILNESFGFIASRLNRAMNRKLLANFKEVDHPITTEQYGLLVHLWDKDGRCQQELCCSTGKDKPSITRLLDHLEKLNLIERIPDKDDKRMKVIYLTQKGKDLKVPSTELALKTLDEMTDGIDEHDLHLAKEVMRKVINKFDSIE